MQLQNFIKNRTATNYTWCAWATDYANERQQSITLQQLTGNLTMANLTQEYHKFTPTLTRYLRKLQTAQIDEMYATSKIHILMGLLFRYSDENLTVSDIKRELQIAENTKYSHQQFIQLYARKLWRIHFIRQNILQKFLSLWKINKFMDEINQTSAFSQDEIYQHKMVGNKLFSWDRFRILGPIDYEHRYTIRELVEDQESYWSPAKLVATISGALFAGTALAFGLYNFFAESTNIDTSHLYTQVSLQAINNCTSH